MSDLCRLLEWDSAFFSRRIARLRPGAITPAEMQNALGWCAQNKIDCLYYLAPADDARAVELAQQHGFSFVDVRITLERKLETFITPPAPAGFEVRPYTPPDLPALEQIAIASHTDTRFFYDPRFPRKLSEKLYAEWIKNSASGREELALVAQADGQPAGYFTGHIAAGVGHIGLFAVADGFRGRGVGQALLQNGLAWFAQHGVGLVDVVTQGRNIGAQRIYQRAGFITKSLELWYHKWFERDKENG